MSPALQADSLSTELPGKPKTNIGYNLYVESKKKMIQKYKLTYLQSRNRFTDIENKLMATKVGSRGRGRDKLGVWINIYTVLYIK